VQSLHQVSRAAQAAESTVIFANAGKLGLETKTIGRPQQIRMECLPIGSHVTPALRPGVTRLTGDLFWV
jgi:hypothetical protein